MSGKSVATVYFYLISAVSLALIVVGIFNIVNLVINMTQYDKYPLRYGPVTTCESYPSYYKAMPVSPEPQSTPSAEEQRKQKEDCEELQAIDRKEHRISDIKNAAAFTLIGTILFLVHFPIARRFSKN